MGLHVRQRPGDLLEVELGMEIESDALHYLRSLYRRTNSKRLLEVARKLPGMSEALRSSVPRTDGSTPN
jgi:hypothetical protein